MQGIVIVGTDQAHTKRKSGDELKNGAEKRRGSERRRLMRLDCGKRELEEESVRRVRERDERGDIMQCNLEFVL